MLQTNISTIKNNLCDYLERVQQGATVVISNRNHPIATLSPYQSSSVSTKWNYRLSHLSKSLKVTLPQNSKKKILREPIITKKHPHLLEALLEERLASR